MIKDCVANIGLYTCISKNMTYALLYLQTINLPGFRVETKELSSDVVVLHQEYATEPLEGRLFENHTDHTDVQALSAATEYSPSDGVTLYALADGTDVRLSSGDFVILFPHDAHVPKLQSGSPASVKKVVVKIALRSTEAS